jgi:hypothetical protein
LFLEWSDAVEKSDLLKLKQEVLDHGAEATLPVNLPDLWLELLARDLDMLLDGVDEDCDGHSYLTVPLAIIVHILFGKQGENERQVSFSDEDLHNYLSSLRFEIALEEVRRCTDLSPEPATLKTIFTNRKVNIKN